MRIIRIGTGYRHQSCQIQLACYAHQYVVAAGYIDYPVAVRTAELAVDGLEVLAVDGLEQAAVVDGLEALADDRLEQAAAVDGLEELAVGDFEAVVDQHKAADNLEIDQHLGYCPEENSPDCCYRDRPAFAFHLQRFRL